MSHLMTIEEAERYARDRGCSAFIDANGRHCYVRDGVQIGSTAADFRTPLPTVSRHSVQWIFAGHLAAEINNLIDATKILDLIDKSPGMSRYRAIEKAANALLGAIERDNTDCATCPADEMWIGHCGEEVNALLAALAMPPARKES